MTVARRGGGGVADGRDPQGRRRGTTGRIAHPSRLISVSLVSAISRAHLSLRGPVDFRYGRMKARKYRRALLYTHRVWLSDMGHRWRACSDVSLRPYKTRHKARVPRTLAPKLRLHFTHDLAAQEISRLCFVEPPLILPAVRKERFFLARARADKP